MLGQDRIDQMEIDIEGGWSGLVVQTDNQKRNRDLPLSMDEHQ